VNKRSDGRFVCSSIGKENQDDANRSLLRRKPTGWRVTDCLGGGTKSAYVYKTTRHGGRLTHCTAGDEAGGYLAEEGTYISSLLRRASRSPSSPAAFHCLTGIAYSRHLCCNSPAQSAVLNAAVYARQARRMRGIAALNRSVSR